MPTDPTEQQLRDELARTRKALTRRRRAVRAAKAVYLAAIKRRKRKQALKARREAKLNAYLERKRNRGRKAAVDYAVKHVGTHEAPGYPNSDRGGVIDRWIRDCGLTPGPWAPWCGCFVHACLKAGGVDLPDGVRYTPTILAWARGKQYGLSLVSPSKARAGDIVLYDWEGDGVMDHTGLVLSPGVAIEGNTQPGSGGNQSDGGGVYKRARTGSYYVRVSYPTGESNGSA